MTDLVDIHVVSGVSMATKEPFCRVTATMSDGTQVHGQLAPAEIRTMALGFLAAAEAAIHDAAVYHLLVDELQIVDVAAVEFVRSLRDHRHDEDLQ